MFAAAIWAKNYGSKILDAGADTDTEERDYSCYQAFMHRIHSLFHYEQYSMKVCSYYIS